MLQKIIKFPLKVAALPFVLAFGALYVVCAIFVGLSSIITNLLSGIFLLGAVAGWITQAPAGMIWQAVGIGIFFAIAPHVAQWLLVQLAGLIGWMLVSSSPDLSNLSLCFTVYLLLYVLCFFRQSGEQNRASARFAMKTF